MIIFQHDGEPGFSGIWTAITAARGFDSCLLSVPLRATHWVRYTTGGVAALAIGEELSGGTSSSTCRLVAQAVENGTAGTSDSGIIIVDKVSAAFQAETLTGGTSTGTVAIAQDFVPLLIPGGQPKMAAFTVETAAINFSMDGTTPTATAGTNFIHQAATGSSFEIRGWHAIRKFKCINAVNESGAILKYTLFF